MNKTVSIGRRQIQLFSELIETLSTINIKFQLEAELKNWYRQRKYLGSRDRKLLTAFVFGYFRWKGILDLKSLNDTCAVIIFLENIAPSPIHEVIKIDRPELTPIITSLEEFKNVPVNEKIDTLKEILKADIMLNEVFPLWMIKAFPDDVRQDIIEGLQSRANIGLRKTLKFSNDDLPSSFSKHPQLPHAIICPPRTKIHEEDLYKTGKIDIQDVGSQVICLAANPSRNSNWWDCCAGGGGKSLYLSQLMENTGTILASDIRAHSLGNLKSRALNQNQTNIKIQNHDALNPINNGQKFDGILVDAPCSGSGTWRRHPAERWTFQQSDLKQLLHLQYSILKNVSNQIKIGGVLVYATCSVFKSENEDIISQFLNAFPNFSLDSFVNPLTQSKTDGILRLIPNEFESDGMFIARLICNS